MIDSKLTASNLEAENQPRPSRGKIHGVITQFMDIMVEGLSPTARTRSKLYDLIVVGGGNVGLTAAMEAARSGLDTLLMEPGDGDGAEGGVQCLHCCQGFAAGMDCGVLAVPKGTEAKCFNLDILTRVEVTSVGDEGNFKIVRTEGEQEYRAKTILLSPGSRCRQLDVTGAEDFNQR